MSTQQSIEEVCALQVDLGFDVIDLDDLDIAAIGNDAYMSSYCGRRDWQGRDVVEDREREVLDRFVDGVSKRYLFRNCMMWIVFVR